MACANLLEGRLFRKRMVRRQLAHRPLLLVAALRASCPALPLRLPSFCALCALPPVHALPTTADTAPPLGPLHARRFAPTHATALPHGNTAGTAAHLAQRAPRHGNTGSTCLPLSWAKRYRFTLSKRSLLNCWRCWLKAALKHRAARMRRAPDALRAPRTACSPRSAQTRRRCAHAAASPAPSFSAARITCIGRGMAISCVLPRSTAYKTTTYA